MPKYELKQQMEDNPEGFNALKGAHAQVCHGLTILFGEPGRRKWHNS